MLAEIEVKTRQLLSDAISESTDLGYYRIQKLIKARSVKINGMRVGADMNVNAGDTVHVYFADREKNSIEVVYRDDNISGGEQGLRHRGAGHGLPYRAHKQPAHRRGGGARSPSGQKHYGAGGVFALNKTAETELLASFKEREIDKTYQCIVVGTPRPPAAKLKAFLFKDAKKSQVYISDVKQQGYLPVETHYKTLKNLGELTLLEVKPITGRTHQIRAQLAHVRIPILGDGKYGINKINRKYRVKTQLLCCTQITFHFAQGALKYLDGKSVVLKPELTHYYKK